VTDFRSIHAAAVEGEYDDEHIDPEYTSPPRQSAAEQIREMQNAARASAHVNATLAGRYFLVGIALIIIGSSFGPGWFRITAWVIGVLLATRGLWCWEIAGTKRREAKLDPLEFLGSADR
jgi:hypothetical protein